MTGAANKVSACNSLSPLQAAVLDALGAAPRPISAGAILSGMTDSPTAAQRVSLSKSLARLEARGLVLRYQPELARQGRGYLYGLAPDMGAAS